MSSSRLTERFGVGAILAPISGNNNALSTGYVDMSKRNKVAFILTVGVSDCTVDFKLQAATSSGGAGVTDVVGLAATQLSATDDGKTVILELSADHLQVLLGPTFTFVKAVVTSSNATGALVSVVAITGDERYASAADYDLTTVAQIVAA